MLIEVFIALEVIAFVFFFVAFFVTGENNSELLWAVCAILFGVLAFSSIGLQSLEPVYDAAGNFYYIDTYTHFDLTVIGFNILFMAISIIIFFMDVLSKFGQGVKE